MRDSLFDIAIVGGGCSGFQMLQQLSLQPDWASKRVAFISDEKPLQRSWCFWSKETLPLQHLVQKSWSKISFRGQNFTVTEDVTPYQYHYISGETFFDFFQKDFIQQQPNVTPIKATVQGINKNNTGFYVEAATEKWKAEHVFSSINPPQYKAHFQLWQHFKGWFVKTTEPIFDETTVLMMDFSVPQDDDVRFVYILPFSPYEALVEMTVFSPKVYDDTIYDAALKSYFETNYPSVSYSIEATEKGQIPMTDAPFSRFGVEGETLIGTAAGMVKASTGYAFKRIGKDSKQIAEDLAQKKPISWTATKGRFRYYDRLLLGIITEEPLNGSVIFSRLFQKMPMQAIFRFLDEETSFWEELKLFSKLPFRPFLKQVAKQFLR